MTTTQGKGSAFDRSMRSIFVGNIPLEASEENLKNLFTEYGPVLNIMFFKDASSLYAFCEYGGQEMALRAIRSLSNYELKGRNLKVDIAASEKSKEQIENLQAAATESQSGPSQASDISSEKAPEEISKAVASLPAEQMFELMKQMKMCIENNPQEARNLLLQNPQLAYALLQAQVIMRIVDPEVALKIFNRPSAPPPDQDLKPSEQIEQVQHLAVGANLPALAPVTTDQDFRQIPMADQDMRLPLVATGDKDLRQITGDSDLRTQMDKRPFDPRFRDPRAMPAADPRMISVDPRMMPGSDPRMAPGVDPRMTQAVDPRMAQAVDPRMAQAVDPRMAQAVDPRMAQSIDPRMAQVVDPRMTQGIDPRMAPAVDPRISQVGDPRMVQGVDPRIAPGVDPRIPQGIDPRIAQAGDPRLAQAVDPRMPQTVDPRMVQGTDPRSMRGSDPRVIANADPRLMSGPDPRAMPMQDPRSISGQDPRGMIGIDPRVGPHPNIDPRVSFEGRSGPPRIEDPRKAPPTTGIPMPGQMPTGTRMPAGAILPGMPAIHPSVSQGAVTAAAEDEEKAALIMQVLQLSEDQIAMLPPEQRQSIIVLKEQIARSQLSL